MATLGTRIYTALKGRFIGEDGYGNKYYEAKSELTAEYKKKRWVIYKGLAWLAALHHGSLAKPNILATVCMD
jgi:NADH:ubiquinone oxidoreductase subunit